VTAEAPKLAARARQIEVSPTVAMAQKAAALRARGEMILDFSVGEPDQATARPIVAAANAALSAGKTRYTPAAGLPELRSAVAARYREDDGVSFREEEAVITTGGKHALYVACQALLERGDEVVVPTPHWPTFAEAVRLAGGKPVLVKTPEKDGFRLSARLLTKAIGPRTKAIIVNSPSNPTGAVVAPAELLAIGRLAARRKLTLLYDDTYARLLFGPPDRKTLPALREMLGDRFVILGTASKTYCMTGFRIGWVLGGKALADACTALISHSTQCPATFAQHAAVAALTGPQDAVREMAAEYRRRRDLVYSAVCAIKRVTCVEPGGGFYVFPNVSRLLGPRLPTTLELAARLLEQYRVAVVPGEGFGAPGHLRLSFARPMQELQDGVARLGAFLNGLEGR
jgi:aspartate aminotransferase